MGVKKNETNKKTTMKTYYEIGQILVSGALDGTKKIGKAGADIFAKSGPEKNAKNPKNLNFLSSLIFLSFSLNNSMI